MSLEVLNTVATLGTFVVISATAIAAMIQLRHARSSNQISALTELRASQETDYFVKALNVVYTELPSKIQDPSFRYQLANRKDRTAEFSDILSSVEAVGDSYENIGVLVKAELVDRRLLLDFYSAVVLDAWDALVDASRRPSNRRTKPMAQGRRGVRLSQRVRRKRRRRHREGRWKSAAAPIVLRTQATKNYARR